MISTYVFTFGMGFTIDISCAVCTKCWVKTNNQPKTNKQSQTMHNGWKKVKLVYIVFRPRYFNIFFYFIYGICFHILNLLSISDKIGSYKQMICFFFTIFSEFDSMCLLGLGRTRREWLGLWKKGKKKRRRRTEPNSKLPNERNEVKRKC